MLVSTDSKDDGYTNDSCVRLLNLLSWERSVVFVEKILSTANETLRKKKNDFFGLW